MYQIKIKINSIIRCKNNKTILNYRSEDDQKWLWFIDIVCSETRTNILLITSASDHMLIKGRKKNTKKNKLRLNEDKGRTIRDLNTKNHGILIPIHIVAVIFSSLGFFLLININPKQNDRNKEGGADLWRRIYS